MSALDVGVARRGQCALVAAIADGAGVVDGASVGDCEAWLLGAQGDVLELTRTQQRKPLLGGGGGAVPFSANLEAGSTLLLGSDGLFKYVPRRAIVAACEAADVDAIAAELVGLPRLSSGQLPDDLGVVVAR